MAIGPLSYILTATSPVVIVTALFCRPAPVMIRAPDPSVVLPRDVRPRIDRPAPAAHATDIPDYYLRLPLKLSAYRPAAICVRPVQDQKIGTTWHRHPQERPGLACPEFVECPGRRAVHLDTRQVISRLESGGDDHDI